MVSVYLDFVESSGNVFNIDVTNLPSPTHALHHFLFSSVIGIE